MVMLAGIQVRDELVLELATMLRRADYAHTADRLESAVAAQAIVLLTIPDRIAILDVLEHPPPGLEQLHAVLQQNEQPG